MYSKRIWICPYFSYDTKDYMRCEGGRVCFSKKELNKRYFDKYCGSYEWGKCTFARELNGYYEGLDD